MTENGYQYTAELFRSDGTPLGSRPLPVDWEPAREWARFETLRSAPAGSRPPFPRGGRIEPVWDPESGPPRVGGFRVVLDAAGDSTVQVEFPKRYFASAARGLARPFVQSGQLSEGEVVRFVPYAWRVDPKGPAPSMETGIAIGAGALVETWPLLDGEEGGSADGERIGIASPIDPEVTIPRTLLDDVGSLSGGAGDVETGGVLVGHLRSDSRRGGVQVEVAGQLPARETLAEATRLTFTSATWTDARRILALRGRGEVMLGWWHSHVGRVVCRSCPPQSQRVCRFSRGFFSTYDRHFQRTAFPRAWQLGLVVNDPAAGGLSFSLFGWRMGEIEERGFLSLATHDEGGSR